MFYIQLKNILHLYIDICWTILISLSKCSSFCASSISARFKPHFWRCEGCCYRKWLHRKSRHRKRPWQEITSPELTEQEVTSVTKWSHAQPVPALFSYYSSSTKCIIGHHRHCYRKWRDRRLRDPERRFPWKAAPMHNGSCSISALGGPFLWK